MKKLIISLGILAVGYSYAQKVSWQKNVESGTQDFLSGLAVTLDGQYLVSGSSIQAKSQTPTANSNKGYDYHILKLDQQGQKVWEKYFSGNQHDYLSATASTQEGGFLLAGTSYSSLALDKKDKSNGSSDMWIVKVDENGEEEWQKTIGTRYSEEARSVVQTLDKGFVVVGSTNLPTLRQTQGPTGYGSKDVIVVKLDKTGKIVNQLILGGKGLDEVEKVIPTNDGGVLMGIYSRSGVNEGQAKSKINSKDLLSQNTGTTNNNPSSNSQSITSTTSNNNPSTSNSQNSTESYDISFYGKAFGNYGEGDYWIVKLDKNGAVQWEKNFGGSEDDHIRTMALTETGYIIGGESRSQTSGNKRAKLEEGTDLWLLSLDLDGNEEWEKSYNFKNRDVLMSLNAIRNSNSETKGFLIGGYTQSEGKVQKNDETFWMLYIDRNGKEVWRKYVEGKEKKNEERLVSAILTRDGSYVLAGTSAEELGKENWKIVKLLDSDVENLIENKDIQIYPNPVKDYCYVEIGLDFGQADIYLYDMTGKIIQQLQTKYKITKVNTSKLPQGVYIIKANIPTQQNKSLSTKIVKE